MSAAIDRICELLLKLDKPTVKIRFDIGLQVANEIGDLDPEKKWRKIKIACNDLAVKVEKRGGKERTIQWYYDCYRMHTKITGRNKLNLLRNKYITPTYVVYLASLASETIDKACKDVTPTYPRRFTVPGRLDRKRKNKKDSAGNDGNQSPKDIFSLPIDDEEVEDAMRWVYSQASRALDKDTVSRVDKAIANARNAAIR